jgi:anti-anti-sigma factor
MDCIETNFRGAVVVGVSGRIDLSNADALREALTAALAKARTALIVDLSGVEYISSAGLRSLVIVFKSGRAQGREFAIAAPGPLVREILAISRFDLVFPIYDTVGGAIEGLATGTQEPSGGP